MKYPRINREPLNAEGKRFFRTWYGDFRKSIMLDTEVNGLRLTQKDVELLAWNCATRLTASYVTRRLLSRNEYYGGTKE